MSYEDGEAYGGCAVTGRKELAREALALDEALPAYSRLIKDSGVEAIVYRDAKDKPRQIASMTRNSVPQDAPGLVRCREMIPALARALLEAEAERERLREATESLLELLTSEGYYWHADDPELEAVNRIRRILGWREVAEEHLEVERQVREAEKKSVGEE